MRFEIGSRTDIGRARERNEDALLVRDPLFVVADGMGGHRGGNVAAAIAVETLDETDTSATDVSREMTERIREANRRILERGAADRALRGMGTTVTALVADDERAHLAHVGDSRAYLFRDGALQQLSEDHTLVQRMVREGKLRPEEAASHPQRSILTRVLGMEEPIDVDMLTLDLHDRDRLLLCSDGLTGMVDEADIQDILAKEPDPQRVSDALVEAANRRGGDDNVTVIVLDVHEAEDPANGAGAPTEAVAAQATRGGTPGVAPPEERADGAEEPPGPGPRRRWGRRLAWLVVLVVIVVAAVVGFRAYVDRQWYVGESGGRVAIFNGIPTTVAGFHLSHVEETTDLRAASVERLPAYGDLAQGITTNVDSLQEARSLVTQMRKDVEHAGGSP
jgi:protein phosphatase